MEEVLQINRTAVSLEDIARGSRRAWEILPRSQGGRTSSGSQRSQAADTTNATTGAAAEQAEERLQKAASRWGVWVMTANLSSPGVMELLDEDTGGRYDPDRRTVILSGALNGDQRRFVLAHELAHVVLVDSGRSRVESRDWTEAVADICAAIVLAALGVRVAPDFLRDEVARFVCEGKAFELMEEAQEAAAALLLGGRIRAWLSRIRALRVLTSSSEDQETRECHGRSEASAEQHCQPVAPGLRPPDGEASGHDYRENAMTSIRGMVSSPIVVLTAIPG